MGLYKRGDTYWMNVMHNAKRIQKSLETGNKSLAQKIYAKAITEMTENRYFDGAEAKRMTFDQLIEKYMKSHEHMRDRTSLKALNAFFSGRNVLEINSRFVSDYRDQRKQAGRKPATIYQELSFLRRVFNVAIREWELLKDNPVSKLSFSVGNKNARTRWLTLAEEQTLLECATNPYYLRALLILALHTGMRRGEILNIRWEDVDFERKLITVMESKNGDKRGIPMSNLVFQTLKSYRERGIKGKVFNISVRSIREAYDKAILKAGINDFHFHDLRHTFATRLVQNGVDLYKIKEILGHKTINMTLRYAHHYPESLRGSIEILDRLSCYNFATIEQKKEKTG
ncbi:MAG: site-specific integrase [Proteobacteria bacterium]|nr:site-specific integrase [Pseudomonadota bacterium]